MWHRDPLRRRQGALRRRSIGQLERELPAAQFARIHRSTIVNLERVREMQPLFHGEYALILQDGTELTLSRSSREAVQRRLQL